MNYRSTNDELVYYKNRILNFIINNSGEYAANEISEIFGFSKRRIQYFVKEFNNKKGYSIKSVKGKYYIKSYPKNFTIIKKDVDREAIKKCIIYGSIKTECGKNNYVIYTRFVNNFINKEFTITKSSAYLQRLINELEEDGYLQKQKDKLFIKENPIDKLDDEKILQLLIYLSIMKNVYPEKIQLHQIFIKILYKYESRGKKLHKEAISYSNKHAISLYDEFVLKYIQKALIKSKYIKFIYRTYKSVKKIKTIPKGLIYNEYKDLWYVVCGKYSDYFYRLDRIVNIQICKEDFLPLKFNKELYSLSLGASHEPLVEVEIEFEKEKFIYRKLLNYKSIRDSSSIIELKDKYILKDTVCGINEFEKWLRAFGKSAICIKPPQLKDKILENIKIAKERYGL